VSADKPRAFLLTLLVLVAAAASRQPAVSVEAEEATADWSRSAAALFLTKPEHKQWKSLRTDAERQQFERAYWEQRDPTPATPPNEFKELIDARIAKADEIFASAGRRGSETARGRAFVLLGPAAEERQTVGPLDKSPDYFTPNQGYLPPGALEQREWHSWIYDNRTPEVLEATKLPSVELLFSLDEAHRDSLQNAARFESIRQAMAKASLRKAPPAHGATQ
jgi:GWxTD domain-containing protein